jgi:flagellum-specific peptidoglycan hydrolase FlgJ
MTGFAFAHGTVADLTSPSSVPVHLLALRRPAEPAPTSDGALRSAIVKAATSFLRMARDTSPADMQALIWQRDSLDGADHGESCAAFASLVLELGAQATDQQSWVTGGSTYPWPLYGWADVRVEPNPDSPGVVSILQDAEAHGRWHPLGDGYTPQPGDWVLFDGHVEVVVRYAGGVLHTIGGDSLPNFSVNAHQYSDPLSAQGVLGFVNNGELVSTTSQSTPETEIVPGVDDGEAELGHTAIPGLLAQVLSPAGAEQPAAPAARQQPAGAQAARATVQGGAAIPGLQDVTGTVLTSSPAPPSPTYTRNQAPSSQVPDTATQQAFISEIAPGAIAAQHKYGIPAAVTIAQAIDESGWGQSELATQDHNLFGIKGTGPAGAVVRTTVEYEDGSWVATTASFRVYHNVAESIADHSRLLATGESYRQAMADRDVPDAFANDLTGVYATDPTYGSTLIALMQLYDLYRYDAAPTAAPSLAATAPRVATPAAAADHGADLPGLEPIALALGGSARPGTAPAAPVHVVPRPRGTTQGGPGRSGAAQGGRTPGGPGRGGAAQGGRTLGGPGRGGAAQGSSVDGGRVAQSGTARVPAGLGASAARGTGPSGARRPGLADEYPVRPTASAARGTGPSGARRPGLADEYPVRPAASAARGTAPGGARIPGLADEYPVIPAASAGRAVPTRAPQAARTTARLSVRARPERYEAQIPSVVTTDFVVMAKYPLARAKPLYQDVADTSGIPWELLAACDWMQCKAEPRHSPVRGEKLGSRNADGTRFRTKSAALAQCAADLITLADAVYRIDLTAETFLSVLDLAKVFAAFRWGALLKAHHVSAMEFPYSVEGLTVQHLDLRWPDIREPNAPDKPGARFRMPFGAVPVVLSLGYPAVA